MLARVLVILVVLPLTLSFVADETLESLFGPSCDRDHIEIEGLWFSFPSNGPYGKVSDAFWEWCFEQQPCLIRWDHVRDDDEDGAIEMFRRMLTYSSGSWLLDDLSHDKRERCRITTTAVNGCFFDDANHNALPSDYFSGSRGESALISARGSVKVQSDVVVGDTKRPTVAEDELVAFLSERRGVTSTRSFIGESGKVRGDEWLAFASATNATLFVRDADGRSSQVRKFRDELRSVAFSNGVDVGVSLYWTPPMTISSVPPHIDTMDVFAIQMSGSKVWTVAAPHPLYFLPVEPVKVPLSKSHYFPDASVSTFTAPSGSPSAWKYSRTLKRDVEVRPGEWLYLPRGTIHNTSTTGRSSLHWSVGVESDPTVSFRSLGAFFGRLPLRCMRSDSLQKGIGLLRRVLFASESPSTRTWSDDQQALIASCVQGVLWSTAAKFILPMRKLVTVSHGSSSKTDIVAYLKSLKSDVEHQLLQLLLPGQSSRAAVERRWSRWLRSSLSDATRLRATLAWWWPRQSLDDDLVMPLPATAQQVADACRTTSTSVDSEAVVQFLSQSAFTRLMQAIDAVSHDEAELTRLIAAVTTDILPRAEEEEVWFVGWTLWRAHQLQQSHEERFAFSEWSWINEQLERQESLRKP